MSNPKISIISPVYNVEKYIRRCVDSILAQTFTDWELILVDDGSTDTSGTICNQYASQDPRTRVIHKQNGGVSAARQAGLDASRGEFVIHADPDDWVEPAMLEELYAKAKADDADMVICDYFVHSGSTQKYRKQEPTDINDNEQTIRDLFTFLHGATWNKLVRKSSFGNYDIKFPEGLNYCEDQLTIVRLLSKPIKVAYLNKAFYHYYNNPSSITRNYGREQYETRLLFKDKLEEVLPTELNHFVLRKVGFGIFTEGIIYGVLREDEINKGLQEYRIEISKTGLRWKLGYYALTIGCTKMARFFIRY